MALLKVSDVMAYADDAVVYDLDPVYKPDPNGSADATMKLRYYNLATEAMARRIKWSDPAVTFALTQDVMRYRLDDLTIFGQRLVAPEKVLIGSTLLKRLSRVQAEETYPDWATSASAGAFAWWVQGNEMFVIAKPTAADAAATCRVSGRCLPARATGTTETFPLPELLVQPTGVLMACLASVPNADEQQAWSRLQALPGSTGDLVAQWISDRANDEFAYDQAPWSGDTLCL